MADRDRLSSRSEMDSENVEMKRVAGRVNREALDKLGEVVARNPKAVANVLRQWVNTR